MIVKKRLKNYWTEDKFEKVICHSITFLINRANKNEPYKEVREVKLCYAYMLQLIKK